MVINTPTKISSIEDIVCTKCQFFEFVPLVSTPCAYCYNSAKIAKHHFRMLLLKVHWLWISLEAEHKISKLLQVIVRWDLWTKWMNYFDMVNWCLLTMMENYSIWDFTPFDDHIQLWNIAGWFVSLYTSMNRHVNKKIIYVRHSR